MLYSLITPQVSLAGGFLVLLTVYLVYSMYAPWVMMNAIDDMIKP